MEDKNWKTYKLLKPGPLACASRIWLHPKYLTQIKTRHQNTEDCKTCVTTKDQKFKYINPFMATHSVFVDGFFFIII